MTTAAQVPEVEVIQEVDVDKFEEELAAKGALVLKECQAIEKIENQEQAERLGRQATDAAANIKAIQEHIGPEKQRRHGLWKRVCEKETKLCAPFEEVKKRNSQLIGKWQLEQEQIRIAEEERLRAEELRKSQELQAQQAEQLASEGRVEEGVAVLESAPEVMPVITTSRATKVAGISAPKIKYKAEIVDLMALVKAVAEGRLPLNVFGEQDRFTKVWILDTKDSGQRFLDKMADTFKKGFEYPGCRLKEDISSSVRASK